MTKATGEIEISPLALLLRLCQRWWLLILCGSICAGAVFLGSRVLEKDQYQITVLFYISNHTDGNSISNTDIDASRDLVDHYAVLLKTGPCLTKIITTAGIDLEHHRLEQMLTAGPVGDTAILQISITGTDPEILQAIAGAVTNLVPEFITPQLPGSSAALVDPPADPIRLSDPDSLKNAVLGFCAGAAFCSLVILIGEVKKVYQTAAG